jgi:hypothetical protein
MLKLKLSVLVGICLLLCATGAMADGGTFDLTASGNTTSISLTLTGTAVAGSPGVFDITSATGTIDGLSATLLPTTGAGAVTDTTGVNGWLIEYDNLLNMNGPYVDLYGLGLALAGGGLANIYYSGGYWYAQLGNNPPDQFSISVTVVDPPGVSTPEPGSIALLAAGLLAMVLLALRKQLG